MAALVMAALTACGDDTPAPPPPADMSILPYDCGLCGQMPPDLKNSD
jgi:hypothetical protein